MSRLWWFNPQCEAENAARVAGYYTARDVTRVLASDLDLLPAYLADKADAVWVQASPRSRQIDAMAERGFSVADYVDAPLTHPDRRKWTATPWGWSPDAALFASRLAASAGQPSEAPPWPEARRGCFAKTTWVRLLREICDTFSADLMAPPIDVGTVCGSLSASRQAAQRLADQGIDTAVIKAPFGTAGQNAKRVVHNTWDDGTSNWVDRIIAQQGEVLVEPWRSRTMDLSVLAEIDSTGQTIILGLTRFVVDRRGQYVGTWLHGPAVAALTEFRDVMTETARRVGVALATRGHQGPFGIDAMVFEIGEGSGTRRHIKPLVEVNPRYTMGHLALALAAATPATTPSMWRLFGPKALRQAGGAQALARNLASQATWPTTDPARARSVLSMVVEDPVARGLVGSP